MSIDIVQDFKNQVKESLDYLELSQLALEKIGDLYDHDFMGFIYFPKDSISEWECEKTILHLKGGKNRFCSKNTTSIQLNSFAEYIAGYPHNGTKIVHNYMDPSILEETCGINAEDFEGFGIIAYASECEDEVLSVLVMLSDRHYPLNDKPYGISQIMDLFAEQIARMVKIHHRVKGLDSEFSPWDGDSYSDI